MRRSPHIPAPWRALGLLLGFASLLVAGPSHGSELVDLSLTWQVQPFTQVVSDVPLAPSPTWPTLPDWSRNEAQHAPWAPSETWYVARIPPQEGHSPRALAVVCRNADVAAFANGTRLPGGCGADAQPPERTGRRILQAALPDPTVEPLTVAVRVRRSAALTVNLRRFPHWGQLDGVVGNTTAVGLWAQNQQTATATQALLRLGLAAAACAVGLFHLAIWSRRRTMWAWLWFGLGALVMAAWEAEAGLVLLPPPWSMPARWVVQHAILWTLLGVTAMVAAAWWFTWDRPMIGPVRATCLGGLGLAAAQLVPGTFALHLSLLEVEIALGLAMMAVGVGILAVGALRGQPQTALLLLAALVASVPLALQITATWTGVALGSVVVPAASIGFLIALTGSAALLGERFTATLALADRTNAELQATNRAIRRFVPADFIALIARRSIVDVELGDRSARPMAVLFADLRGFTTLSEGLTPDQTFDIVNTFLSEMATPIHEAGGFIDKYIGDEIMALFPGHDHASPETQAVRAAIGMQAALSRLVASTSDPHIQKLWLGIGIHTGPVVLGVVGAADRLDGTVIADAVNLASRVEGLTRTYDARVLITAEVVAGMAEGTAQVREVDVLSVRGRSAQTKLYQVMDAEPAPEALPARP